MTMPLRNWWHELSTWEPEIALAFYGRTLGWQFDPAPLPDGSAYWIAREEGRPVGGIFELGTDAEAAISTFGDLVLGAGTSIEANDAVNNTNPLRIQLAPTSKLSVRAPIKSPMARQPGCPVSTSAASSKAGTHAAISTIPVWPAQSRAANSPLKA